MYSLSGFMDPMPDDLESVDAWFVGFAGHGSVPSRFNSDGPLSDIWVALDRALAGDFTALRLRADSVSGGV